MSLLLMVPRALYPSASGVGMAPRTITRCARRPPEPSGPPPSYPAPLNPPVHHFSTVLYPDSATLRHSISDSEAADTLCYGRWGSPVAHSLEAALAAYTHAEGALVTPSKRSALIAALTPWLKAGDAVAVPRQTVRESAPVLEGLLPRLGIDVRKYSDAEELAEMVEGVKVVLFEAPVPPRFTPAVGVEDAAKVGELCRSSVVYVLDNYGSTIPYNQVFLNDGDGVVDVVVTSADRCGGAFDGNASLSFGIIACRNKRIYRKVRSAVRGPLAAASATASPNSCEQALLAMRSADVRRDAQATSAQRLAATLIADPAPGVRNVCAFAGALDIGLELQNPEIFINSLTLIRIGDGVGAGNTVSLLWPQCPHEHCHPTEAVLSVGLEASAAIEADIRKAASACIPTLHK